MQTWVVGLSLWVASLSALAPSAAHSHDRSKGKSFFEVLPDGHIQFQIGMNNLDFLDWSGIDLASPNRVVENQKQAERFLTFTLPKQLRVELLPEQKSCPVKYRVFEQPDHRNLEIFGMALCAPKALNGNRSIRIDWGLFAGSPLKHTSFSRLLVRSSKLEHTWAFSHRSRKKVVTLALPTVGETFQSFSLEGFWHLVTGWDHLLFLLLLFLAAPSIRHLIFWVTTFTLAHAVSLLANYVGLITAPGVWVEAGIAASICLAAWPAWRRAASNEKKSAGGIRAFLVILAFGLLHGLGFASFLSDLLRETALLYWAVFSFHVGLELAQVLFLLLCLILLWPLRRKESWHQWRRLLAAFAFSCGFYWFCERLFF